MTMFQKLAEASEASSNEAIQAWRGQGKKVVGFFCAYFPEEILTAADILPHRVRPAGCTDTTAADA